MQNREFTHLSTEERNHIEYTADGRMPIEELYKKYNDLIESKLFIRELVHVQKIEFQNQLMEFPIYLYRTSLSEAREQQSILILSGVHGEEPAGPGAIAESVSELIHLAQLGNAVVILPLLNPAGYFRNWRYENIQYYDEQVPGQSVSDSEHVLLNKTQSAARRESAIGQTASALVKTILQLVEQYRFNLSMDLHEDSLLTEGAYIYSQGAMQKRDPIASALINIIMSTGMPIHPDGKTRFTGEIIRDGVVTAEKGSQIQDGSIDELIASARYYADGMVQQKHPVPFVYVTELPTQGEFGDLRFRINVYKKLIEQIHQCVSAVKNIY